MNSLKLFAKTHKNKKGFTLVELVIVIAVLAIIAAIAIPSVIGVVKNANAATDASNAQALTATIKTFIAEKEASVTHPLTGEKIKLTGDSTFQDLLNCYGVVMPTIKSGGGKLFVLNPSTFAVTINTTASSGNVVITATTTLKALGIIS